MKPDIKHSESQQWSTFETDWISKWAMYSPNAIMVQDDESGTTISYEQARVLLFCTARILIRNYGIKPCDRVAVLSMNRVEYIILFFAIQKAGAIMVPLNYRLTAPEIKYQLDDAAPVLLLLEDSFSKLIDQTGFAGTKLILDSPENSFLETMWSSITEPQDEEKEQENEFPILKMSDVCKILYTSGTTGRPKGAMISNGMLFWNSVNTGLRLNLVQQDVTLIFAPFFHTGGWNVLTTPFIHRGAKLILLKKFDPDRVLQQCDDQKVSVLFGVPTMMDMLYRSPEFEKVTLNSLRYVVVGGEPMPVPLIERWQEKGVPVRQGYGLTEFGPNVFSLNEEDAIRKKGSVGFPNFYIDAAIQKDDGSFAGANEAGELLLRGPVCMSGYWEKPDETSKTVINGWLHTGDIVKRDDEGYYYIIDRKKEMYISGAENVYPAEVEHVYRSHPAVREIAVIGVPDEKWGESGKAFVVLNDDHKADASTLQDWGRERLAKYKVPAHFQFLSELPKSDSGKILKRKLRDNEK
ncbi:MAG: long-chain fatty acid--CoA ligase [Balneolales bacterium]|nr:long-chain fatty acid--CoA ligase [Balneolales bacterium]